jgi:polysaccharide pyruvyl transferase CsaB
MKQRVFWGLAILALVVSGSISFRDRERPLGLVIPFEVFKNSNQPLREKFVDSQAYFTVHSQAELVYLSKSGIALDALVACSQGSVPTWFSPKMAHLSEGQPDLLRRLSSNVLAPSSRLNLVYETDPLKRSLAGKLGGVPVVWIHRIYPDEIERLSDHDRLFRWRRALRERSVRFIYYEPREKSSGLEGFEVFLRDVVQGHQILRLSGNEILSQNLGGRGIKTAWVIFILVLLGFWFNPIFWVLPVFFLLPYPLDLKLLSFAFNLCSVFLLYFYFAREMRSSGAINILFFLPIRLLFHTSILGGTSYFLLSDPGFHNRLFLPAGVRILLALPLLVVIVVEFLKVRTSVFSKPLNQGRTLIVAGISMLVTLGLTYHIFRSGNEGSRLVFELELHLREILEHSLYARPRAREILGLWGLSFLFLGVHRKVFSLEMIGRLSLIVFLTSSFNTYSHLHTDYWFILLREFNAFWIGAIPLACLGFLFLRTRERSGVLHLGYYGSHNLGDDLLAESSRRSFAPEQQVFITLNSKADLKDDEVPRQNILQIMELMTRMQTFSLGPGGILQDQTSMRSLVYYLGFCVLAKGLGMRVLWFGHGVSPLRRQFSYRLVSWVGCLVSQISVRDEDSRAELLRAGIPVSKITVVPDLAMDLEWSQDIKVMPFTLGIVLRSWPCFPTELWLKELETLSIPRRYFLFQEDLELQVQIEALDSASEIWVYSKNPLEFSREFQASERIISMRYHGILLAYLAKRPVLGLVYDKKCQTLLHQLSLPHSIDPCQWTEPAQIRKSIQSLLND